MAVLWEQTGSFLKVWLAACKPGLQRSSHGVEQQIVNHTMGLSLVFSRQDPAMLTVGVVGVDAVDGWILRCTRPSPNPKFLRKAPV